MTLTVRPAIAADRPALWAMLEPVIRAGETYAYPTDWSEEAAMAHWLSPAHSVFVAADETPLGTYYLKANQAGNGDHVCNAGFVTAPAARGRGVARAMLAHALDEARRQGFAAMQFNCVVATNTRAIAIWQDHGFETVGRLPGAFRHPVEGTVDALVMYRHL
ncbi:Ribosomal protein S18 acetylase RimI [Tranquillimonas rosea]|uniref:Ribosomal protein S18 acetylase RimI n=1 Tax=Tranquillimonas rosea TaxID=641238 RepID=A0A1H9U6W3_9RHOB|nr:N-acetyltransferase [Tranquillimonas rosea]SES04968.1 Ribosomal protein S18 acetylase RimI [Tranquillimonas rosea]